MLLLLCPVMVHAQEVADTVTSAPAAPAVQASQKQLRLGFDISRITRNLLSDKVRSYEVSADYYFKKELYFAAEAGFGSSTVNYPVLRYNSDNFFVQAGIDKALFTRKRPNDWSLAFVGLRYGVAVVKRGAADYNTDDGLGNKTSGTIPSDYFSLHWLELAGGMKLELFRGVFAGWTVRSKFALNQKSVGDLKPEGIAGFGAAEKNLAFDFNFYISYALRWSGGRK
ncbi:MAG: DUF6048 family protein [Chitinophagaceae bacterium]